LKRRSFLPPRLCWEDSGSSQLSTSVSSRVDQVVTSVGVGVIVVDHVRCMSDGIGVIADDQVMCVDDGVEPGPSKLG
jgi:hypothetical protein